VEIEGVDVNSKFSKRFKKDLTKVSKYLDQVIMLDDTFEFVLEGSDNQANHVFFIGSSFLYFESFQDAELQKGEEYIPKDLRAWELNKKKLNILQIAFERAYDQSTSENISFSHAMKIQENILNLKDLKWNDVSSKYYKEYIYRMNQNQRNIPSGYCQHLISDFLSI
jgi:ABC-type Zn uptake system ZnuABC Zn-binding protein ZnuA